MVPHFDGQTYDAERDHGRLSIQLEAVKDYMLTHEWVTLGELVKALGYTETSVPALSARIRDLRKSKFGGYTVHSEHIKNGLWRYRITGANPVLCED